MLARICREIPTGLIPAQLYLSIYPIHQGLKRSVTATLTM
jgi:hypothetical protein